MTKPETDRDVANVEAWAEIVRHLLHHVPPDKRTEVLALASKNEEIDGSGVNHNSTNDGARRQA